LRRLRKDLQIGTFANLVAKDLQKAVRMESANDKGVCQCVTCGKQDHWKLMHAGHFIPGRRMAMLFVEENIHPQCNYCNTFLSGNVGEYERFLLRAYGKSVVASLHSLRVQQHKYTREQLADMRDGYKRRIKLQEQRLG